MGRKIVIDEVTTESSKDELSGVLIYCYLGTKQPYLVFTEAQKYILKQKLKRIMVT